MNNAQRRKLARRKLAADLVAEDRLSNTQIAKIVGVDKNTIRRWFPFYRKLPDFNPARLKVAKMASSKKYSSAEIMNAVGCSQSFVEKWAGNGSFPRTIKKKAVEDRKKTAIEKLKKKAVEDRKKTAIEKLKKKAIEKLKKNAVEDRKKKAVLALFAEDLLCDLIIARLCGVSYQKVLDWTRS